MRSNYILNRLYDRKRDILILREFDHMSTREIAKLMGIASRSSVQRFLVSDRYLAFKSLVKGDPAREYILKKYPAMSSTEHLNELSEEQVLQELKKKPT